VADIVKRIGVWVCLVTFGILLAGCSSSKIQNLSPEEIISRSNDRMKGLKGFEYLIQRTGALVFFDYEETIAFSRAEGQYVSPDRVFAKVRVIMPGLVTEVNIISIGGIQWETNLLTGKWQSTDPLYSFNPSILFNANNGIQFILANDVVNPVLVGLEGLPEIPGRKSYSIEATMPGDNAYDITFGMIDKDLLRVTLWVDTKTFDLNRIIVIDPANPGDDEDTTWQIDFWNFDTTFDIQEPVITDK